MVEASSCECVHPATDRLRAAKVESRVGDIEKLTRRDFSWIEFDDAVGVELEFVREDVAFPGEVEVGVVRQVEMSRLRGRALVVHLEAIVPGQRVANHGFDFTGVAFFPVRAGHGELDKRGALGAAGLRNAPKLPLKSVLSPMDVNPSLGMNRSKGVKFSVDGESALGDAIREPADDGTVDASFGYLLEGTEGEEDVVFLPVAIRALETLE